MKKLLLIPVLLLAGCTTPQLQLIAEDLKERDCLTTGQITAIPILPYGTVISGQVGWKCPKDGGDLPQLKGQ